MTLTRGVRGVCPGGVRAARGDGRGRSGDVRPGVPARVQGQRRHGQARARAVRLRPGGHQPAHRVPRQGGDHAQLQHRRGAQLPQEVRRRIVPPPPSPLPSEVPSLSFPNPPPHPERFSPRNETGTRFRFWTATWTSTRSARTRGSASCSGTCARGSSPSWAGRARRGPPC